MLLCTYTQRITGEPFTETLHSCLLLERGYQGIKAVSGTVNSRLSPQRTNFYVQRSTKSIWQATTAASMQGIYNLSRGLLGLALNFEHTAISA